VLDALQLFVERLSTVEFLDPSTESEVRALREIAPEQRLAPAQFTVEKGRIVLSRQDAVPLAEDAQNVQAARNKLIASGNEILGELRLSNCDPRLIKTLAEIQNDLASATNIIQLGLTNF
jgi:hypothetical protein